MFAVKAVYDNGTVKWTRRMTIPGRHNLIVLFEDVSGSDLMDSDENLSVSSADDKVLPPLPELEGTIQNGWKDAIYGP